jgi:hypothetical protein
MIEKRYLFSCIAVTLLASLAVANVPVQAPPPVVRIYVNMPLGHIPGVPPGNYVNVHLRIESPMAWDDTLDGIVGWAISAKVDPTVLEPMGALGAQPGYFLYDFWVGHEPPYPIPCPPLPNPIIDKEAGTMRISEFLPSVVPVPGGAGGSGRLVTLVFRSLSETAYSPIDLYYEIGVDAWYWTAEFWQEIAFPVDVVEDGQYNLPSPPPLPEFPLGSVAPIALIVAVAYLWLMKKRERSKVMCPRKER